MHAHVIVRISVNATLRYLARPSMHHAMQTSVSKEARRTWERTPRLQSWFFLWWVAPMANPTFKGNPKP